MRGSSVASTTSAERPSWTTTELARPSEPSPLMAANMPSATSMTLWTLDRLRIFFLLLVFLVLELPETSRCEHPTEQGSQAAPSLVTGGGSWLRGEGFDHSVRELFA